ncbi:D-alanyl-D-alanine carboxypeptidase [Streptomyces atratus]|uniref:D-alanyl-D-alanine carboxypeptidase n=1 Tax=Streptomyces atratus TaxID=1893 RepID=A0A2Z5JFC2_STRAR|nr:D-alanyl-D-alanine carboxypeptidase [Streptomyces atratus]AXE78475.1 D-alanyl-D-alanine carboxypeptidase [Streptomyces atratus]
MSPRRMEEASVAGESPDRSKQQKSSGTARSESDPRLSVFREPSAGSEAGGGTDTATAVFRTGPVPSSDGEGSESVKADSATAVFRARPSGDGEDGEDSQGSEQPEASGAAEGSSGAEGAEGAQGAGEATEGPEGASESSDESSEAAESSKNVESAESVDVAEPAGAAAPEEGDTRLRAAVAAWVTKDDDQSDEGPKGDDDAKAATSEDESAPDADADADTDAVAGGDASEPATPADGASDKATASNDADAADEPSDDASEDAEDSEDAAASEADAANTADADSKADKPGKPETAEDKRGIDQPTAVFRAPAAAKVDQPTTALKIIPPTSKPDSGAESKPESAAERTSKFVPLRGDDIRPAPAPRKPEAPAAASASRPGTPPPAVSLSGAERTTQQPMPPKPPLDLLAELTNTPPPPQTPVRTAVRRVKIWTPLVLLLLIVFAIAQVVRPLPTPTLALSVDPTYTFGGGKLDMPWPGEGQGAVEVEGVGSLGTYGPQKAAPIASVAKIMTAYVILKDHPITGKQDGGLIEVDKKAGEEANRPDESTVPIKEGQKYTQRQMLQLLMIPSGNNVARLLARWDAKTEEAFVERMNAAAKDLGMTNSMYTDPSGLESSTTSTPADQLKLAKAVMQNDVFREIVNMPQADIPGIGKTIYNNNVILLEPGVSGIKTGSSTPAGGNLVWAADTVIDGKSRRIVGVVMGAQLDGTLDAKLQRAIQNSLKLIKAAQKGVVSAAVVKKGDVVGYVDDGLGGRTPVVSTKDLKAIGWGGLTVNLKLGAGDKSIPHTAKAGTVVGEVTVGTGTGKVSAPVTLQSEMTEPSFGDKLTRIG